jgi:hypothetical protein
MRWEATRQAGDTFPRHRAPSRWSPYHVVVPDERPPRLEGDERQTLQAILQYHRDSVVRKVTGVSEEDARHAFVDSGTTLLWLVKHLALAESMWILRRFAGEDVELPSDIVYPDDTLAAAIETYRQTWTRVGVIVAGASLDESCRNLGGGQQVNLRWVLTHLVAETARHAGHADIVRELIDGTTGR